ncbi:MAG: DUF1343 domain-containing protein [Bacteroidales bacterium]|nr:DUF1343 domain-containing protein [Bacteroidales bacterium]
MRNTKFIIALLFIFLQIDLLSGCKNYSSQDKDDLTKTKLIVGAENTNEYLSILKNKNVALVVNQSSYINQTHLVDSLISLNIKIIKNFAPEHGLRGTADAGEYINNNIDEKTGIPIISLYGKNKKPQSSDLQNIDIVVYDIQDVGVRFYTYISTMHYVMEACAENNIDFVVLDRPNPNGFLVDGPVLDTNYRSFVGMHKVPLVYGMTIGEYALMINGEGWLKNNEKCKLQVITCKNYTHHTLYNLPIKPSPNLPNMKSVNLYPSLGLFEGTVVSVGRGTDFPFQVIGHPDFKNNGFSFVPKSIVGAAKNPKFKNIKCFGLDLRNMKIDNSKIDLDLFISAYKNLNIGDKFFNPYFDYLAGNNVLRQQIISGLSKKEIRKTWQKDLKSFKKIRKKYLLYP